jgi:hypothetical protein
VTRTIAVDTLRVYAAVETTQLAILGFVDDRSTFVTQGLQLSYTEIFAEHVR